MARHDQRPADWMFRCVVCEVFPARPNGVMCSPCKANLSEKIQGGTR